MLTFNHFNFNVLDMQRSLAFYMETLNLTPLGKSGRRTGPIGSSSFRTRQARPSPWS